MLRFFSTWLRLACALFAWGMFVDCASTHAAVNPAATTPPPPPHAAVSGPQGAACGNVRNAPRTFIGVAAGQPLDDFAASAVEAGKALRAIKSQLCVLKDAQDPGGELRGALARGSAEITVLRFLNADLAVADVELQRAPVDGELAGALRTQWLVRVERVQAAWHVVSASAQ